VTRRRICLGLANLTEWRQRVKRAQRVIHWRVRGTARVRAAARRGDRPLLQSRDGRHAITQALALSLELCLAGQAAALDAKRVESEHDLSLLFPNQEHRQQQGDDYQVSTH
jgi:hypothetical protein